MAEQHPDIKNDNLNDTPTIIPHPSKRKSVTWKIVLISQFILVAAIAVLAYFFWYKPAKDRDQWEREQYMSRQRQQKQAAEEEALAEKQTQEQIQTEIDSYLNTTRGKLESEGFTYMGMSGQVWECYEITDKYAMSTSREYELYSVSNGNTTRWVATYDDDVYPVIRGSYSKREEYDDGPSMHFNAKVDDGYSIYFFNI